MPNVLMIIADDLNAWVSVLGGYGLPVSTPNMERLSAMGVTFTSANVSTSLCNPSRAAMLSGMSGLTTGIIGNQQEAFSTLPTSAMLPAQFKAAGWTTATAGKVFHRLPDDLAPQLYDHVLAPQGLQDDSDVTPLDGLDRGGIFNGDPATLRDAITVSAVEQFIAGYAPAAGAGGLFLTVGLTGTHGPRVLPAEFFDLYPLEGVPLPEVPPGDLDDIPDFARQFIKPVFEELLASGNWRAFVQAYLASVSYIDSMLGRLLDALEASAIADDTMVVFVSDNGYHLGEKQTLHKHTLWDSAVRVPLIIADPGAAARGGTQEDIAVSLLDLYPTLLDYAGLPNPAWAQGESLLDLLRTGDAASLSDMALTLAGGNISLRTSQYRYTRYEDGSEELYDMRADPHELVNLARDSAFDAVRAELAADFAKELARFSVHQNTTAVPVLLQGGDGRDMLIAGFGPDTLNGGFGNDTYMLRSADAAIVEPIDGGHDTALIAGTGNFTLPVNVEDLLISRIGANLPDPARYRIEGNGLDNWINLEGRGALFAQAGDGNDTVEARHATTATLQGGAGDDRLAGSNGSDQIEGDSGNDTLLGGDRVDMLDGGAGDDRMSGDDGGDIYRASGGVDVIIETGTTGLDVLDVSAWGGLANLSVTESMAPAGGLAAVIYRRIGAPDQVTVAAQDGNNAVEVLRDATTVRLLLPGSFTGTAESERIEGSGASDTLNGGRGEDALFGHEGDDRLVGGPGLDTLTGGAGNDGYILRSRDTVVVEMPGGGMDTVFSSVVVTLASGVEVLVLNGDKDLRGTGNALDNTINGNRGDNTISGDDGNDTLSGVAGHDVLDGGKGDDVLSGGDGADRLVGGLGRDTLIGGPDADIIRWARPVDGDDVVSGFASGRDAIEIDATGFKGGLAAGMSLAVEGRFVAGTVASAGTGQFLFHRESGKLLWDRDGIGPGAPVPIADFGAGTMLAAEDFRIVG